MTHRNKYPLLIFPTATLDWCFFVAAPISTASAWDWSVPQLEVALVEKKNACQVKCERECNVTPRTQSTANAGALCSSAGVRARVQRGAVCDPFPAEGVGQSDPVPAVLRGECRGRD